MSLITQNQYSASKLNQQPQNRLNQGNIININDQDYRNQISDIRKTIRQNIGNDKTIETKQSQQLNNQYQQQQQQQQFDLQQSSSKFASYLSPQQKSNNLNTSGFQNNLNINNNNLNNSLLNTKSPSKRFQGETYLNQQRNRSPLYNKLSSKFGEQFSRNSPMRKRSQPCFQNTNSGSKSQQFLYQQQLINNSKNTRSLLPSSPQKSAAKREIQRLGGMGNSGYFGKTSSELNKSFNNSPSKFQKFKLMTHVQLKSNVDSVVNDFISKRYHNSPLRPSSTGANSFLINWNKVTNVQQGQKSPAKQALESAYSKQQMKKQSLEKEGSFFKKGLVNDLFESPFKKTSKYDLSNQQQQQSNGGKYISSLQNSVLFSDGKKNINSYNQRGKDWLNSQVEGQKGSHFNIQQQKTGQMTSFLEQKLPIQQIIDIRQQLSGLSQNDIKNLSSSYTEELTRLSASIISALKSSNAYENNSRQQYKNRFY